MNAFSSTEFANSVPNGKKIQCPNCNTLNDPDCLFCENCGTKLIKDTPKVQQPMPDQFAHNTEKQNAFEQIDESIAHTESIPEKKEVRQKRTKQAFNFVTAEEETEEVEESVFAKGLPDWTINPPQVVAKKKVRM